MELSDVLCVFSGRVQRSDGSLVVQVPDRELTEGALQEGQVYRVALFPAKTGDTARSRESAPGDREPRGTPPVAEGDALEVEIEDIGDQGDGIARIASGYIVFVPETTLHERVTVEITDVKETMAFADVIGRQDR